MSNTIMPVGMPALPRRKRPIATPIRTEQWWSRDVPGSPKTQGAPARLVTPDKRLPPPLQHGTDGGNRW